MDRPHPAKAADAAAVQFMVLDILGNILNLAESPSRMGLYLTQQIRELVGARIVLLAQRRGDGDSISHRVIAIEPARYQAWDKLPALEALLASHAALEEDALWPNPEASLDAAEFLGTLACQSAIVIPLWVGTEPVGTLLALDLLDLQRSADILRSLEMLEPVVALVLRNATYYESLEGEIASRTRELTQSLRHFRTLTEVAPVGIFHLDGRQQALFVNEHWRRITGLSGAEEFPEAFWAHVDPVERQRVRTLWDQAIAGHHPFQAEFTLTRPNGEAVWVLAAAAEICSEEGEFQGLIGTLTDFTEQRRLEAERARFESQFLQSQKLESIGRLAGGVAHDINNMLSAVMGHAELLEIKLPPGDPRLQHIREIERACGRSRDIIRQLLAFSRKQVAEPVVLDLNQRIAETKRTMAPLIGEDIELVFLPGANLRSIRFDPSQVDQVLVNLAVNARDAMPRGGRIVLETANVDVGEAFPGRPSEAAPGPYVRLRVSDEGVGMSREVLAQIFEPFFTTKPEGKGTGLGLSTVFGIVKQNGGFLDVESELGAGTSFRIYLPAVGAAPGRAEESAASRPDGQEGTVLVVEDDEILRGVIPTMLERMGYRVLVAAGPEEALGLCSEPSTHIDLLLSDVVMPGMSGRELRDEILRLRPGLRVLFMSGYTSEAITRHGVLEEGLQFIQKPFSIADLGRKVAELLAPKG